MLEYVFLVLSVPAAPPIAQCIVQSATKIRPTTMCGGPWAEATKAMNEATLRDVLVTSAMQGWLSSWPASEPHPADLNTNAALIANKATSWQTLHLSAERAKGLK